MISQPLRQDDDERNGQEQNDDGFRFAIPLLETERSSSFDDSNMSVPQEMIHSFEGDGFCVFPDVISTSAVEALNDRLEDVLRGVYDRGRKPDKIPKLIKGHKPPPLHNEAANNRLATDNKREKKKKNGMGPIGFSGNLQNVKVLQIINIHKADSLFRKLETNLGLAKVVSQLAGWNKYGGARLAQDQFWGKPPNAPPLVFHRDSPYFMFEPSEVVTVWVALDDMETELGPLEYVVGSHKWGDGRIGSANQFFQQDTKSLLMSAAEREGILPQELQFVSMDKLRQGGLSIHHGKIWHGSAKNNSKKPRRGLGLHFVPANVRFTSEATKSRLWKPYVDGVEDPSQIELSEEDFPLSV